jgi:pimeloyl-ACP methyl ester carboxylesterase
VAPAVLALLALVLSPPGPRVLRPAVAAAHAIVVAPAETLMVSDQGSGRPVVLVPGLVGGAYLWRKVVPLLAEQGYRVIVVEPLGIGASSRPKEADYTLEAQATRVAAVLDALGVRGAMMVSHTVGSSIALRLSLQRPELVGGLVSIGGGAAEVAATSGLKSAIRFAGVAKALMGEGALRARLRSSLVKNSADTSWITPDALAGYAGDGDHGGLLGSLKRFASAKDTVPLAPRLAGITVPMLLLIGGEPHPAGVPYDEILLLGRSIPKFRQLRVPGSGLHVQEEQPAVVVRAVALVEAG